MRASIWIILYVTSTVAAVLSLPTSETNLIRVQIDGTELSSAASNHASNHAPNHHPGAPAIKEEGDLQASGGIHPPLVYAIPQLALLLSLLQLLLEVIYKSPQFAQFQHFTSHHPHPALLHAKVGPHGSLPGLYGNGLYGVSATTSLGKGRPFGPYKYEDNQ